MATTGRDAVDADVVDLLAQVGAADVDLVRVLGQQRVGQRPAGDDAMAAGVGLQRPDRGHDDGGVGTQARVAALDVEEALGAHVGAEAGLGDQEVARVDADQVGQHRRVAVGDVPERPGVDEHRSVLQGLQEVRLDGVAQDRRHRTAALQVGRP